MSVQYGKPIIRRRIDGSQYREQQWIVACDALLNGKNDAKPGRGAKGSRDGESQRCENQSTKPGSNAGEAAMNAKREGWQTISLGVTRPLSWRCPNCSKKILCRKLPPGCVRSAGSGI